MDPAIEPDPGIQICANDFAGVNPSNPIERPGAYPGLRGQTFPCPTLLPTLLFSLLPTLQRMQCRSACLPASTQVRIRLLVFHQQQSMGRGGVKTTTG